MKVTTRLLLLLPLLSLVMSACSTDLPSQRRLVEFPRGDGPPLRCYEPPPDVIAKGGKAYAELAASRLTTVLQGKAGVGLDVERIRQELPQEVQSFELFHFRMCVEHGNGILSKEDYRGYIDQILPAYRKNPPVKVVSTPGLVETCGPSFSTKRPAVKFVPFWASVVNTLRENRNVQFYDLENLMQVRGRIPVEMGMISPYEEIFFTLDCLERIGYLKVEKFDPPRMLSGTVVENRKIIFSDPTKPVPN